ncbi:hypothetical protein, partial [Candidatus Clavichlamydia salmonicola]|uniref:hypothetical protein n=1 Tax=Candidatus Clavichlamydia salmonicola TaxID=469812 RepID=UPI00189168A0
MLYFTLDYSTSSGNKSSFIVKETSRALNLASISSLTVIIKDILNRKLPCASVSSSFVLHPLVHNNTVHLLNEVIDSIYRKACTVANSAELQLSLKMLSSTINTSLLSSNIALFENPLPTIVSLKRKRSFQEDPSQNNQSRIFSSKEEPFQSPLKQQSPCDITSTQFSTDLTEELDLLISRTLENNEDFSELYEDNIIFYNSMPSSPNQKVPLELLTNPSNQVLPIITILEDNQYFILQPQDITNIPIYLDHVLNGVRYVLEHRIFFHDNSIKDTSKLSFSDLYHDTLSTLLIFLLNLEPLLVSIPNDDDKINLGIEKNTLVNKVMEEFQQKHFSDYAIASIMESLHHPNLSIASPSLQEVIQPTLEEAFSQKTPLKNSDKQSCSQSIEHISPTSSQKVEIGNSTSTYPRHYFIHLNINKDPECLIYMINQDQKLPHFIAQIKNLILKGRSYTCHSSIAHLGIKPFNIKADLFKALYILLQKNFEIHLHQKKVPPITQTSFKNTLIEINKMFCLENKETINPDPDIHSPELTCYTTSLCFKNPEVTHYHIFLRSIRFHTVTITKLHIEKLSSSHPKFLHLLKQKEKNIINTLKHL